MNHSSRLPLFLRLLKDTYTEWQNDHPDLLAAGLGYFTLFSLAPVLVIASAVIGQIWTHPDIQAKILDRLGEILGEEMTVPVQRLMSVVSSQGKGQATVLSGVTLVLGASRVFAQVRAAMNIIWEARPPKEGLLKAWLRALFMNVAMLLGVAAFILGLFASDAAVAFLNRLFGNYIPGIGPIKFLNAANWLASLALFSALFAGAYKFIPDTRIAWKDVWLGALLTSILFVVGKGLIGLYLRFQSFGTVYGAASSVIVIMVWIYFAAQIFFFGAEFTKLYALRPGSHKKSR